MVRRSCRGRCPGQHQAGVSLPTGTAASIREELISNVGAPEGPALPEPGPTAHPFPPRVPVASCSSSQTEGGRTESGQRAGGQLSPRTHIPQYEPHPLAPPQREAGKPPVSLLEVTPAPAELCGIKAPRGQAPGGRDESRDPGLEGSRKKLLMCGWGE